MGTDVFQRRAAECRRLAAAARNASDKAFWLGLVERWQTLERQALESQSLRPVRREPKYRRPPEPELPPSRRALSPSAFVR
jgi:hypothetical protein